MTEDNNNNSQPLTEDELAAIRGRFAAAYAEVVGLCNGSRRWTMSIPVEQTRDSDRVIVHSLHDVLDLLATVEALQAERGEWGQLVKDAMLVAQVARLYCCTKAPPILRELERVAEDWPELSARQIQLEKQLRGKEQESE